jgi:hypothetical protein
VRVRVQRGGDGAGTRAAGKGKGGIRGLGGAGWVWADVRLAWDVVARWCRVALLGEGVGTMRLSLLRAGVKEDLLIDAVPRLCCDAVQGVLWWSRACCSRQW